MTLTTAQRNAVRFGQPATVEIDGKLCVVILKDVFEKARQEQADAALEIAWGEDPGLDAYQDFKLKQ